MKKILFKLLDAIGEILLYFTVLTCVMIAAVIAKEATWWLVIGTTISLVVYLCEHRKKKGE